MTLDPEDFARQFFDMWQDSFTHAMEDPNHMKNLLHFMEQSNDFWKQTKTRPQALPQSVKTAGTPAEEPQTDYAASHQQSARVDDHRDGTVQELARRVEKCEQRIEILETIIRSGFANVPADRESRPQGERNARIQIPERH